MDNSEGLKGDMDPEEGWAITGNTLCSLPTQAPSVSGGDLMNDPATFKRPIKAHYDMPTYAMRDEMLGGAPKLMQNSGEYKEFKGEHEFHGNTEMFDKKAPDKG